MITGGRVKKVSAENIKEGDRESTGVNINLLSVKVEKNKVTVEYNYTMDYNPGIAKISLGGEVYLEEKNAREIEEKWKKDHKLPDETAADVLTALTYTASAVGTLMAFAVNIPAPINVPRARIADAPEGQKQAG